MWGSICLPFTVGIKQIYLRTEVTNLFTTYSDVIVAIAKGESFTVTIQACEYRVVGSEPIVSWFRV